MAALSKSILILMLFSLGAAAKSSETDVSVYQAIFPLEINEKSGKPPEPAALEQRPIFVFLDKVSITPAVSSKAGQTYMLARDAVFRVVQEAPLVNPPVVHMIGNGSQPCRLHIISEVIALTPNENGSAAKALKADGCITPRNAYAAPVVVGPIDHVMWIGKAPTFTAPTLELQEIPKGMSPNSSTAKIVIPEMNRMRQAEFEAAKRDIETRKQAAVAGAKAKGGMLDNDERLKPFIEAVKKDEARKGFTPDLFISAGTSFVHFSHPDGRSFMMSFGADGRVRIKDRAR